MENNILYFLSRCITRSCSGPAGFTAFETQVYLAFCLFNVGRLFTYLPTIAKLRKPGCTGDGQSVLTWVCWILANITLSYYALISSKYQITDFVWLNILNTLMCLVCLIYVIKAQKRAGTLGWVSLRGFLQKSNPAN
jgi:hypothetical protein